jgi:hypothetical protein
MHPASHDKPIDTRRIYETIILLDKLILAVRQLPAENNETDSLGQDKN